MKSITGSTRTSPITHRAWWRVVGATLTASALLVIPAPASQAETDRGGSDPVVRVRDLGTLREDISSQATDINSSGVVVGVSTSATGENHAVLWRRGRIVALATISGARDTAAFAINDRGLIVGRVGSHAAQWFRGRVIDLGTLPGGTTSQAQDVSENGVVVGYSDDANGQVRPVTWVRGQPVALPLPASANGGHADAINDHHVVVGSAGVAVQWRYGALSFLAALPGGVSSQALGVNDRGTVVGYSRATDASPLPVVWRNGTPNSLTTPPLTTVGMAEDVNGWGSIAGWVQAAQSTRPIVWRHGSFIDLNDPGTLGLAMALNDVGQVVGWSAVSGAVGWHAALWTVRCPAS